MTKTQFSPRCGICRLLVWSFLPQRFVHGGYPRACRFLRLHRLPEQVSRVSTLRSSSRSSQLFRPWLRRLDRHLLCRLADQPLLRHLPSGNHLPPLVGRARLPRIFRLPPRRRKHLLQPKRRPSGYQCPSD